MASAVERVSNWLPQAHWTMSLWYVGCRSAFISFSWVGAKPFNLTGFQRYMQDSLEWRGRGAVQGEPAAVPTIEGANRFQIFAIDSLPSRKYATPNHFHIERLEWH